MAIKGVVFDMDGVLLDTEQEYQKLIHAFFAARGLELAHEDTAELVGCTGAHFVTRLREWWARTPDKLEGERELDAYVAIRPWFDQNKLDYAALLNPGVAETLDALAARGIKTAVASSTDAPSIKSELTEAGVYDRFAFVLSGDQVEHGKPAPDVYLAACAGLGLAPADCIAVEDSDRGIAAGLAAGMRVAVKREDRFCFTQEGGTWYLDRIDELIGIVDAEG